LPYATGSTRLAITVRGSSRRIMIMRFRPANIRLINRRSNLPRLLLTLSSGKSNNNDNNKNNPIDSARLTGSLHIRANYSSSIVCAVFIGLVPENELLFTNFCWGTFHLDEKSPCRTNGIRISTDDVTRTTRASRHGARPRRQGQEPNSIQQSTSLPAQSDTMR
jgi:hypothetical protein